MSALLLFWLLTAWPELSGRAPLSLLFSLFIPACRISRLIAERKDVLSAFFWMLTLCLYVYYTEKPAIRRYLLVLFGFACALMSKPMVITLPVIMIFWITGRWTIWIEKRQLRFMAVERENTFFYFVRGSCYRFILHPKRTGNIHKMVSSEFPNRQCSSCFYDLSGKNILAHDMLFSILFQLKFRYGWYWGPFADYIITTIVVVMVKRMPFLFVGWMWYAVTIALLSELFSLSLPIRDGRPLPLSALYRHCGYVGMGIPFLIKSEQARKRFYFRRDNFSGHNDILSWDQCGYWKNSIELGSMH